MKQYDIALIGGDARTAHMLSCFMEHNYSVICYGIEKIAKNDGLAVYADSLPEAVEQSRNIVGGIPLVKCGKISGTQDLPDMEVAVFASCLRTGKAVFGGMLSAEFMEQCREQHVICHDFMQDEALAVFNAVATAEGAILKALKHKDTNIHGSQSLVIGYGRCGSVLADKLKGLNAFVTVCSQSEVELAKAAAAGLNILHLNNLKEKIHLYEYIYNTVPAVLLTGDILVEVDKEALVIDIASNPGGIDKAAACKLNLNCLHCLGLPGKYAPKISAKGLADFVMQRI